MAPHPTSTPPTPNVGMPGVARGGCGAYRYIQYTQKRIDGDGSPPAIVVGCFGLTDQAHGRSVRAMSAPARRPTRQPQRHYPKARPHREPIHRLSAEGTALIDLARVRRASHEHAVRMTRRRVARLFIVAAILGLGFGFGAGAIAASWHPAPPPRPGLQRPDYRGLPLQLFPDWLEEWRDRQLEVG